MGARCGMITDFTKSPFQGGQVAGSITLSGEEAGKNNSKIVLQGRPSPIYLFVGNLIFRWRAFVIHASGVACSPRGLGVGLFCGIR